MKREFGRDADREVPARRKRSRARGRHLRRLHPGHTDTPTVILVGRNRGRVATTVRAVLGIRASPGTPDEPGKGRVDIDRRARRRARIRRLSGSPSPTSTAMQLATHPWSLTGGGAVGARGLAIDAARHGSLAVVIAARSGLAQCYRRGRGILAPAAASSTGMAFRRSMLVRGVGESSARLGVPSQLRLALCPLRRSQIW